MISRFQLPRFVERGVATTLSLDVYSDAGVQQTASAATLTLYEGSTKRLDAVAATTLGPPATYDLLAATTSAGSLGDDWLEVWALTIGGVVYEFRREMYVVVDVLYPHITDTDLTDRHPELSALRSTGYEAERDAAFAFIERKLIGMGRRPQLIISGWALIDVHTFKTLELIFRGFHGSTGDGRYAELEQRYRDLFDSAFESLTFRYDLDEDGVATGDTEQAAARPTMWLGRPARGRGAFGGW